MSVQSFPSVELVFVSGCPHLDQARAALREALDRKGMLPRWVEWNVEDATAPHRVRGYGSPTILVRGHDVTGTGRVAQAKACRADGVPTAETIEAALDRYTSAAP